jgi:CHAT domain-containing protein
MLLGTLLALCLLVACGREQGETRPPQRGGDEPSRRLTFHPGEGRLAGLEWSDISSTKDLRSRAPGLRRKAIHALASPQDRRTIGALRAEAVVLLLDGRLDEALGRFSQAVELAPASAAAWSDLAAVRLQRGAALSDPYDFFLALAAANRAFHLSPALPAVQFNRALALQRLSLNEPAGEMWRLYQRSERDPHWLKAGQEHVAALAQEARRPAPEERREAVERAVERGDRRQVREIVAGSPQIFREYVERDLLVAWAEATAARRDAEAQRKLTLARAIGEALAASNGERMAADTVAQIDDLQAHAPQRLPRLVKGIRVYGRGISLIRRGDFSKALAPLQTSLRLLTAERSPLAGWSTYWIAICHYQHFEYPSALALLSPLTRGDRYRDRYAALHGQALRTEGVIAIIQGNPTASLTAYQAAMADFRKLGETAYAGKTASLVASSLDYLGQRSEAWRWLYPALIEPAVRDTPSLREGLCLTASWLANEEGEREIALLFQNELVQSAQASGVTYRIVEALRGRAEILAALDEKDRARTDLVQARQSLDLGKNVDPGIRQDLDGNLKWVEAQLARIPEETISLLDSVIRTLRSSSYRYRLWQALFARARAKESLGRSDDAERDLSAAIDELERQRQKIATPEEQISYFDRTREIFDTIIQLQLGRRHQLSEAFRYSERAKARVLLDWVLAQPVGETIPERARQSASISTSPASLQRQVPSGTTVVEYWALPGSLQIWVLRRDRFATETVPVGAKDLEALVQRLSRGLEPDRKADFLKTSSTLYELLIQPIARHLTPADRLVVVPDGALHGLSFALLRDGRSGRYLIQDHVCSVAPSVRLLIASLRRAGDLASPRPPRVLAMEDPAFDSSLFYRLPRLRASHLERIIPGLFPGSRTLREEAATRSVFLSSASDFEILHFGGHSLVSSRYPLLSQMLFAPDKDDRTRGVLHSGDLLGRRFAHTRLAVLASCSTAAGRISSTEGVESLARPFLAAGVPEVVASLWDVDDPPTADFFVRFYRHLAQRFDVAGALQATQLESIERGADPKVWAAFEVIGGGSVNTPAAPSPG